MNKAMILQHNLKIRYGCHPQRAKKNCDKNYRATTKFKKKTINNLTYHKSNYNNKVKSATLTDKHKTLKKDQ